MGARQDDTPPEDRDSDAPGPAHGSPARPHVGLRKTASQPAAAPQHGAGEQLRSTDAEPNYNTVLTGKRFYVIEHDHLHSGGRRLFTAGSLAQAVRFLLEKAWADGLVPWDVGWDKLNATLYEERTYRDAAYTYSIVELEEPAAFNN